MMLFFFFIVVVVLLVFVVELMLSFCGGSDGVCKVLFMKTPTLVEVE